MRKGNVVVGLLIGAVIALIPAYYFYTKYQQAQRLLKNPQIAAEEETKNTITKLSALMELPKDEKPTILTVTDKAKLKSQSFFNKAENGDKVVLYITSKKAILFREKQNKIIEVAPINIEKNNTATPSAQPKVSPTPKKGTTVNATSTPSPTKASQ